jgi:hypothetical protein
MAEQLEILVVEQMRNVASSSREKIIDTENIVVRFKQPLAQVRSNEPRPPCNQNSFPHDQSPTPELAANL